MLPCRSPDHRPCCPCCGCCACCTCCCARCVAGPLPPMPRGLVMRGCSLGGGRQASEGPLLPPNEPLLVRAGAGLLSWNRVKGFLLGPPCCACCACAEPPPVPPPAACPPSWLFRRGMRKGCTALPGVLPPPRAAAASRRTSRAVRWPVLGGAAAGVPPPDCWRGSSWEPLRRASCSCRRMRTARQRQKEGTERQGVFRAGMDAQARRAVPPGKDAQCWIAC